MSFFSISDGSIGFPYFGAFHMAWLIGLFVLSIIGYRLFLEKGKVYFLLPFIPFALKLVRVLILVLTDQFYSYDEIPLHMCNISLVVYVVYALTKWKGFEEYIFAVAMPAALVALLSPGWDALPRVSYYTAESFISHAILVAYPMYLLLTKALVPNVKNLPKLMIGLILCAMPIHAVNLWLGTNFCYIEEPLAHTPLALFDGIFGLKYQFGLMLLVIMMWVVWYGGYFAIIKARELRLKRKLIKTRY